MKKQILLVLAAWVAGILMARAQPRTSYSPAQAHSHNDYEQTIPFLQAYDQAFGSVEADIYARNGQLYVAHDSANITPARTLEALYINPIVEKVRANKGKLYANASYGLQWLIDLKTPARLSLPILVRALSAYPDIFGSGGPVKVVVSGNVPTPDQFKNYPDWLQFDGRPEVVYTPEQLAHVGLISQAFPVYTRWNGKGLIVKNERARIQTVIQQVHRQGKKIRFWATPDNINTWKTLMNMGVDYINTDQITPLGHFLSQRQTAEYQNPTPHTLYQPTYRNNDSRSRVKNVILLIGDGMGLAQIYAGLTANRGDLNLAKLLNIGFSKTSAADTYITDSAAGATAMATGQKTNNRAIGVDSSGNPVPAIPTLIKKWNMVSGLISAGPVTDATPAAFYAHQPDRMFEREIASDFLRNPVQILIGGGYRYFKEQNVLDTLHQKGYQVGTAFDQLESLKRPFVLLDDQSVVAVSKGRKDFLQRSLQKTLHDLDPNKAGFFVMAEGAQIDYGGHANDMRYVVDEMLDFDRTIGDAIRFADSNGETLVIITADHETGGLSLLDGDLKRGYIDGNFSTNDHSGIMVPVFAYGPHSLDFRGVYENTEIHHKIMAILQKYHFPGN
ncbi:alkaline phosphatase [Spirosoma pollinicola]|uniref:Alkaline phosphatase n=1 Tax=Spirosoma pollinicola TaxID=2057025 RepID=A0A2K8YSJ7_9BACT|nr:alkaline phosphatase [Spirosoma pollinicola]AUD00564.1 alkaline phosphatase [Spirosoma pollinicola]